MNKIRPRGFLLVQEGELPAIFSTATLFILYTCIVYLLFPPYIGLADEEAERHLNSGVSFVKEGNYDSAISEFEEAIKLKPDYAEAYLNLGYAWEKKGQKDKAMELYAEAIRLNPNYGNIYAGLGSKYHEELVSVERIIYFKEAAKRLEKTTPNMAGVTYSSLGGWLENSGQYDQAIKAYEDLVKLYRDDPCGYKYLGWLYTKKGEYNLAIRYVEQALQLDKEPEERTKWQTILDILYKLSKKKKAASLSPKIQSPSNNSQQTTITEKRDLGGEALHHFNSGVFLAKEGKFDSAISELQESIKLKSDYAEAYNSLGFVYAKKGQYDQAIKQLEEAIRLKPDFATAYGNLGMVYYKKGEYDLAIKHYEEALRLKPDYEAARKTLDDLYKLDKETGGKQEKLKEDIKKRMNSIDSLSAKLIPPPPSQDLSSNLNDTHQSGGAGTEGKGILEKQGLSYDKQRNSEEETFKIEKKKKDATSAEKYPENKAHRKAVAHHELGISYRDQGKLDLAINEFQKAIELNPDFAEAHAALGLSYHEKGLYDLAIKHHEEVIRLKPGFAAAHYVLGVAYFKNGQKEQALKHFEESLRLDPNDAATHHGLGNVYSSLDKHDLAISQYEEAIRLKPDYVEAYNELVYSYSKQGQYDMAIKRCEEALKLDPGNQVVREALEVLRQSISTQRTAQKSSDGIPSPTTEKVVGSEALHHFNSGVSFVKEDKYDSAISEFEEAIKLKSDYAEAYLNLGYAWEKKKQNVKAMELYAEAIRLNPNYKNIYVGLGSKYHKKLDPAEIIRLKQQSDRFKWFARAVLGLRHLEAGEYEQAEKYYEESIRLQFNYSVFNYSFFEAVSLHYAKKGEYDKAIKYIKQLLQKYQEYQEQRGSEIYAKEQVEWQAVLDIIYKLRNR